MDARLSASADNRSAADIALDKAIGDLFRLIPEAYRRGKTAGQTIEFSPPKNPFEEKEYPHNTVRSLYIILLLTKQSQIFNCDNWSTFGDFDKFIYLQKYLGIKSGRALLKHLHALDVYNHNGTHSWVPRVVDPLTFEAGKVLSCLLYSLLKLGPEVSERDQLLYKRKLIEERLKKHSIDYRIDYIKRKSTQLENKIATLLATGPEIERAEKNKLFARINSIYIELIPLINSRDPDVFVPISQVDELLKRITKLPVTQKNPEYDPLTLDQLEAKLIALEGRQKVLQKLIHDSVLISGMRKITITGINFLKKIKIVNETEPYPWPGPDNKEYKESKNKISTTIKLLESYIEGQKAAHRKLQDSITENCITPLKLKIVDIKEKSNNPHNDRRIKAIQETIDAIQAEIAIKLPDMTAQNFKDKSSALKENVIGKMIQLSASPVFDMGIKEGLKRIALRAAAFFRCTWAKNNLEKRVTHCKSALFRIHTVAQKNLTPKTPTSSLSLS